MTKDKKQSIEKAVKKFRKTGKVTQGGVADQIINFSKVDKPKK